MSEICMQICMVSGHLWPSTVMLSAPGFIFNDARLNCKLDPSFYLIWVETETKLSDLLMFMLLELFITGFIRNYISIKVTSALRFLELQS